MRHAVPKLCRFKFKLRSRNDDILDEISYIVRYKSKTNNSSGYAIVKYSEVKRPTPLLAYEWRMMSETLRVIIIIDFAKTNIDLFSSGRIHLV